VKAELLQSRDIAHFVPNPIENVGTNWEFSNQCSQLWQIIQSQTAKYSPPVVLLRDPEMESKLMGTVVRDKNQLVVGVIPSARVVQ